MIERFTEKAIKVILFAQEEAFLAKNDKLYPEHILLGIMKEGSGLSAKLLKASGIDREELREKFKKTTVRNSEITNQTGTLTFSPPVKKLLREAWYQVQSEGTYYVTPENLFLCLLREDNSEIINTLNTLDVDTSRIVNSVKKVANKSVKPNSHPEDTLQSSYIIDEKFDSSLLFEDSQLKTTMDIAQEKLVETNHEAFGTEQLVSGILENQDSWISGILAIQGITRDKFYQKLEEINSRKDEYNEHEPEFTPKASRAVKSAYDIAKEYGSTYVKPEHIILGVIKENDGLACRVFKEIGINLEDLSEKILQPIEKEKPEALTILKLAKEEAIRMEQNIVGTEQILLGILGEGTGIAANVLRDLGVTLKDARIEVAKLIGYSHNFSETKEMVYTPRAKRVLDLSRIKAKKFKRNKVGSEHLLLGITREKESIAMKVLENLGVDVIEIRQGILNEIKKRYSSTEEDI